MKYADRMCNLLAYIAENSKDKRYKISGKYLESGEILTHILKYTYNEVYAVTKNMVQSNKDINKPVSYYLSALDNQLKINDPEAYASVLDPSLGRNSKLEDIELDDDEDEE